MAVTVADVTAREEFASTSAQLIEQSIADAEMLVNRAAYATDGEGDLAVKYKAMHLIAMSPYGERLRLDPKKEADGARSLYERLFNQIAAGIARVRGPVVVV